MCCGIFKSYPRSRAKARSSKNEGSESIVKLDVHLRALLSEPQSERLRQRLPALPFKVTYQEEQHGPQLIVRIECTSSQEKPLREILRDIGVSVIERATD